MILLELVEADGSWGVHNPKYTESLIEKARTLVMKARNMCGQDTEGDL